MSSINVLVYDDQLSIAKGLAQRIESACEMADVQTATSKDFHSLLNLLNRRRAAWRPNGEANADDLIERHLVDDTDVIVVDYDLLSYSDTGDTTGSRLAYLLRCFSTCGLIVLLNEYGRNSFDASLGNPVDDFADVHIGDVQIDNPGLWSEEFEGYRPWQWPVIPDACRKFRECVLDVQKNLDEPIIEFLDLSRVVDWMPTRAREFLAGKRKMEDVTFRNFIKSSQGGIDFRDELISSQQVRVAAARIITFLNSIILPSQNILVDAPHLASRFPSLIEGEVREICSWNKLCNPIGHKVTELLSKDLNAFAFQRAHWLWKPAWYWPQVFTDETIPEVREPWLVEDVGWVFCENVSKFRPIDEAEEFYAIVSPPFVKRYVDRAQYRNAHHRGSLDPDEPPEDPSLVEYVPQSAFSR